jgi:hypothetical protein
VESRILPETTYPSDIGNYYGDIYEKQLELAKNSSINQADRRNGGVPPQWAEYIKPFI